jgi:DNA-directed RNA polymerase specialized sigma24 family protein
VAQLDEHDWQKLVADKTKNQVAELELLRELAGELTDAREALEGLVASRNRELVRACDYYVLKPEDVAKASGMSIQRVNQILSQLVK